MDDRERVQAGHLRELPAGTQYRAGGGGGPGRTPGGIRTGSGHTGNVEGAGKASDPAEL